jgi:hypothetical protein
VRNDPARTTAFATLALLYCPDRIASVLLCLCESRREELSQALDHMRQFEREQLKAHLMDLARHEDAVLKRAVHSNLGPGIATTSLAVQKLVAFGEWP